MFNMNISAVDEFLCFSDWCKWTLITFKESGKFYIDETIYLPNESVYRLKQDIEEGKLVNKYTDLYRIFIPADGFSGYPFMVFPSM